MVHPPHPPIPPPSAICKIELLLSDVFQELVKRIALGAAMSRCTFCTCYTCTVLRIRDPESSAFLTLGSGMEYNTDPGSEIQDKHVGSYFREPNSFFLIFG